ncbi:MAG: Lrp/AsnC family transcriptional regulator [Nanoarchaeota archaeon]|nr:Lrp/AsnC family transcriptional regulator [Nanoarchaeota archaeon]
MTTKRELALIRELRKNSRQSLTKIGENISAPLTSLCKIARKLEKEKVIQKYATLLDYNKLGYFIRVQLSVQVEEREKFREFMMGHSNVNSLSRVANNSFFAELIFKYMLELENFLESLAEFNVKNKKVFYIIEELKQEEYNLPEGEND